MTTTTTKTTTTTTRKISTTKTRSKKTRTRRTTRTGMNDPKERLLRDILSSLGSVIVAYSGGVDSAYLAWVAHDTLGDRALAVTADSPSYPERHRRMAVDIAARFGLRHEIIETR